MEKEKKSKNEEKPSVSRPIFLYVILAMLIFFGVQQYNSTINDPTESSFTEFKQRIQDNEITKATIKAQSICGEFCEVKEIGFYEQTV